MAVFSSLFFISCHSSKTRPEQLGEIVAVVDSTELEEEGIAGGEPVMVDEKMGEICVVDSTAKNVNFKPLPPHICTDVVKEE